MSEYGGSFVGADAQPQAAPERQLIAALILQALIDAQSGDCRARLWMDQYAPAIAARWLGLSARVVAAWRKLPPIC